MPTTIMAFRLAIAKSDGYYRLYDYRQDPFGHGFYRMYIYQMHRDEKGSVEFVRPIDGLRMKEEGAHHILSESAFQESFVTTTSQTTVPVSWHEHIDRTVRIPC